VITCTDSGGPLEFVRDGETGFVVEPTPAAMAVAFARLMDAPGLAEQLGARALAVVKPMTWPAAVQKLVIV
jgi:glycosyltransferase involved in cell wall biosynthesis